MMRVEGIDFLSLTVESLLELLPETESDQWEWKSAILLEDGKSAELEAKLSKGLSAFANTGGGHFIFGLEDGDKTPKPCRLSVGRQDMETWLYQKIASYTSPPVLGVKIFRIPFADDQSKAIFLLNIPDSAAAPHQAHKELMYYWRRGPISEKAPHFHVDNLFRRVARSVITLEVWLKSVSGETLSECCNLTVTLGVELRNDSHILAKPCGCSVVLSKDSKWGIRNPGVPPHLVYADFLFPQSSLITNITFKHFIGRTPREVNQNSIGPSRGCVSILKTLRFHFVCHSQNYYSKEAEIAFFEHFDKEEIINATCDDTSLGWWSAHDFRMEMQLP